MHYAPIIVVSVFWVIGVAILLYLIKIQSKKGNPNNNSFVYEELPIIYDNCTGCTAQYSYILRIVYGNRNKRFFFPNATITIKCLDGHSGVLAKFELQSAVLVENHRRYLKNSQNCKLKYLYVLIKRRESLDNVKFIVLDHNISGGIIMIYNVLVLSLLDNLVYGSKIGKSIQSMEKGFKMDTQRFSFPCFGQCNEYVGPTCNLTYLETFCLFQVGVHTILFYCSSLISCKDKIILCRSFESLSSAFETSLYASLVASLLSLILMLVNRHVFKRLNALCKNIGCIWILMHVLPFIIWFYCIAIDVITVYLVMTTYKLRILAAIQKSYWLISTLSASAIYTSAWLLLVQLLWLYGFFEATKIPTIDIDSGQFKQTKEVPKKTGSQSKTQKSHAINSKSDSASERNLLLKSKLIEKTNASLSDLNIDKPLSISKIIDAYFTQDDKSK